MDRGDCLSLFRFGPNTSRGYSCGPCRCQSPLPAQAQRAAGSQAALLGIGQPEFLVPNLRWAHTQGDGAVNGRSTDLPSRPFYGRCVSSVFRFNGHPSTVDHYFPGRKQVANVSPSNSGVKSTAVVAEPVSSSSQTTINFLSGSGITTQICHAIVPHDQATLESSRDNSPADQLLLTR